MQNPTATNYKAQLSLVYGLKLNDLDDFDHMYHDSINNFLCNDNKSHRIDIDLSVILHLGKYNLFAHYFSKY